mgnify:CR=1 FL=1
MNLPREISDALDAGCNDAHRLKALLEEEFEALRGQSLDAFEKLQPLKTEIFATLAQLVVRLTTPANAQMPVDFSQSPNWISFQALMAECRDAHRRNDVLIRSKLEAIRGALRVLQSGESSAASVEVYDRLGRIGGYGRGRGYTDA